MKVVGVRLKKGVAKSIKDSQKIYYYICPLQEVEIGEFLIVDLKTKHDEFFTIARVEEVIENAEKFIYDNKLYGFVVCKVPLKNFEERCSTIVRMKESISSKRERNKK